MTSPDLSVDQCKGPVHAQPPRLELVDENGVINKGKVTATTLHPLKRSECAY
jgi:hypothetical protein